jgi:hypothetical protein
MSKEDAVRASFAEQSYWCERLGSPFMARLCSVIGERLDRTTAAGRRALAWPGEPSAAVDALALRLCGGLHALVRTGAAPALAELYPPAPLPEADALWAALAPTLGEESLALWLERPPQTNEVGRSAVLMAGLLALAERFAQPMHLYELGASAGLNLRLDAYRYDLGGRGAGDPASALLLKPEWAGSPPPAAEVVIAARRGVDLHPADPVADRDRLIAYVWPDQARRLAQIETALAIAADQPVTIDAGDAADWLETMLPPDPLPGATRVVLHSVAFQYFPAATQARVTARIEAAGDHADADGPLAWLRFEKLADDTRPSLRLRTWPGGDELLAWVQPHGAKLRWLRDC